MYDRRRVINLLAGSERRHMLPQPFYTDPELYDFDVSAVFGRSWLMLGFESELPDPGSYLATTIGPHLILVVRGREGAIRGFHNICRHRGAQICAEGSGRLSRIVCPYHKWSYDLEGRLVGAARMPQDLNFEEHALVSVQIELLEGCIYGTVSAAAPDFRPFREAAAPFLHPYHLADTKVAHQSVLTEKANWKLVMENARECYHCSAWHPELRVSFPVVFGTRLSVTDTARGAAFTATMAELGLPVGPAAGDWWHIGRYPLNAGMESLSMDGRAMTPRLLQCDGKAIGGLRWATEPNAFCHGLTDYVFMFAAYPIGPQETRVVSKWLVPRAAREGVDYALDELTELWTKTNLQDRDLAENNQRGVNGLGYRPGPYATEAEELVIRFNDWYRTTAMEAAQGE
jgi:Rieske 2Fe-2S family protein